MSSLIPSSSLQHSIAVCYTILPAFCFQGYIAQHKKRTKFIATRHDFWAQNVPKMLLRPGLRPEASWGTSQRYPRPPSWIWGTLGGREGRGTGREGKFEGRRVGKGRRGREKEGRRAGRSGPRGGCRPIPACDGRMDVHATHPYKSRICIADEQQKSTFITNGRTQQTEWQNEWQTNRQDRITSTYVGRCTDITTADLLITGVVFLIF